MISNTDVGGLEKWFALTANGTTVRTELLAGVTTFLTMAYIIFVQPAVLSAAGMDFGAVLAATCLATAFATALMALLANYPIAVAPAMGHNFFFAYSVVIAMKVPWRVALGAVAVADADAIGHCRRVRARDDRRRLRILLSGVVRFGRHARRCRRAGRPDARRNAAARAAGAARRCDRNGRGRRARHVDGHCLHRKRSRLRRRRPDRAGESRIDGGVLRVAVTC